MTYQVDVFLIFYQLALYQLSTFFLELISLFLKKNRFLSSGGSQPGSWGRRLVPASGKKIFTILNFISFRKDYQLALYQFFKI